MKLKACDTMAKKLEDDKYKLFDDFFNAFYQGNISIKNFYDHQVYYELWAAIYEDLRKRGKYLMDGRRDDAFEKTLIEIDKKYEKGISYEGFLDFLIDEIEKYNEPNMLILPLNGLDKTQLPDVMEFDNKDIKLFSVKENNRKIHKDNTLIAVYVKNTLGINFDMQHMLTKDRNFFNTPVLTVLINGMNDNEIYYEAQEIAQGIYSLIRMYDLFDKENHERWHQYSPEIYPLTYAVYNKCGESTSDITNGCGHQMKFFSSPILDINTAKFIKNSENFANDINFLIDSVFEPEINSDKQLWEAKKRWINSLQMFNTAYELASIERFDATQVTLISILESLFLKNNSFNKKSKLSDMVSDFMNYDYHDIINSSYKTRSKYVHEGKRLGEMFKYKLAQDQHNYIPGYKPFTQYSLFKSPNRIGELEKLMNLCAVVIFKIIHDKKFLIGQYNISKTSKKDETYEAIQDEVLNHLKLSATEKSDFYKYLDIRGLGVYYDTIKSLVEYTGLEKIDYYDFMGLIRYDKNLRDKLYKMLGVHEESLKDVIYRNFNYTGKTPFIKIHDKNIDKFVFLKDSKGFGWNLYRNPFLDFGSMYKLIISKDFVIESKTSDYKSDLDNVRVLRNMVMHHKMLLLDQSIKSISKALIEVRISKVLEGIQSLYNLLEADYDKGLISAVNKANYDESGKKKSKYIFIPHLEGGYE